jgi:hypothetical protein
MTDTGLYSGIYEGIRNQADLLDRVLVHLNAGTTIPDDDRQELAAWLISLADPKTPTYSVRMIRLLLRGHGLSRSWDEIGKSIASGQVTAQIIGWLEELARALEKEQATALARLRGDS